MSVSALRPWPTAVDGSFPPRLPPPIPNNSPAQEVYERASTKTDATPVYDNTPRHRVQEAVEMIYDMQLPHWLPGTLLRADKRLREAAIHLCEDQPARWEESLQPLANPKYVRQNLLRRVVNRFRRDDCGELVSQQHAVTVQIVALEQWCWALLNAAKNNGCNVPNKIDGLTYTLALVDEALNCTLAEDFGRHVLKLRYMYRPRLEGRIARLWGSLS